MIKSRLINMGYCVTIQMCGLEANGLEELPPEVKDDWELSRGFVEPVEYCFTWREEFVEGLLILAREGVTGEIELLGDAGEYWKYVLREGRVEEYEGEVVYSPEPVNVRFLLA